MTESNRDLFQIKIFCGFFVFVIFILILKELKYIFIPLFLSSLLYFFFNGVVKKLLRFKVPKFLVLTFLLIFIFILFYFLGVLISSSATSFIEKFPAYSEKINQVVTNISDKMKIPIAEVENFKTNINWSKSINTIASLVGKTFGNFATFFGNLILVLLFLMFMLAGRSSLIEKLHKAFSEEQADKIKYIINSIENKVQHYLLIKTFVSALTAVIGGIIIFMGGFDFVLFSALMIFVLNFIPNFGSIVATMFPVLIGILNYGFSLRVLLVALGLMTTQFVIGSILEPNITGRSLNISPLIILISLIFWSWTWGIVGMILAVPLTSSLKIIFSHIEVLKPVSELLSSSD